MLSSLIKVATSIWKGIRWWLEAMDRNYIPTHPRRWRIHNRMSGWSLVVVMLFLAGIFWSNASRDTIVWLKLFNTSCAALALAHAGVFAWLQHGVWKRGEYFNKPVKTGYFDGEF